MKLLSPLLVAGFEVSANHYICGERFGSTETFDVHCPIDERR